MKNILVPVDFSPITERLVSEASRLARAFESRVWLVHVAPPDPEFVGYEAGPQTVRDQVADRLNEEHRSLQSEAEQAASGGVDVTPLLVQGPTVETILKEAERCEADLILLGSHGHGALYRALVGSICEGVLRRATCPVLIIPDQKRAEPA